MNEEAKMLDDIFKFMQRCDLKGAESDRHVQCKQYLANKIREMSAPMAKEADD